MSDRIRVGGLDFDDVTSAELLESVQAAIRRGVGGTIVTPNVDICKRASRDPSSHEIVGAASFVVPDGMPLIWAAKLAGRPLRERITGADLIWSLSELAAASGWPVYVVGGLPGTDGRPGAAELAACGITARYPGLPFAGSYAPPPDFDAKAGDIEELRALLVAAQPKVVFVGLGFPKQERLIARLAADLPGTWFVGCGAAILFAAGTVSRAPVWMQRVGMEWIARLVSEPKRLARRYLVDDLPFAVRLLAGSIWPRHQLPPDSDVEQAARERTAA